MTMKKSDKQTGSSSNASNVTVGDMVKNGSFTPAPKVPHIELIIARLLTISTKEATQEWNRLPMWTQNLMTTLRTNLEIERQESDIKDARIATLERSLGRAIEICAKDGHQWGWMLQGQQLLTKKEVI